MGTLIFSIYCTHTVSYSKENENHEVDLIRTAPPTPFLKVQATLTVDLILLVGNVGWHVFMCCVLFIAYKCTYNLIPYYDSIE